MKIEHITTSLVSAAGLAVAAGAGQLLPSDASLRVYATSSSAAPAPGDTITVTFFADVNAGATPSDVASRLALSYDFSVDFAGLSYVGGSIADASGTVFGAPALGLGDGTLRAFGLFEAGGSVGSWPAAGLPLFSAQFTVAESIAPGTYSVAPRNNTLAESTTLVLLGANLVEPVLLFDNDLVLGVQIPGTDNEFASTAVTFEAFTFSIIEGCSIADVAEGFGSIDINDILIFADAFDAQNPLADLTGEGDLDINDILTFADAFDQGCPAVVLFEEDFEGLPRQNAVSATEAAGTNVWGNVAPAGWNVNNAGVPANGVPEFTGWTFLDPAWWALTSGQNRGAFTRGTGTIAVADSDEWADGPGEAPGTFNTMMTTPAIDIAGRPANSLTLTFDSSWRPEGAQTAAVLVSYDGGPFTQVLLYNTANTVDLGPTLNQGVEIQLDNPEASNVRVRFDYLNGSNNWWWAIDNVRLLGN